MGQHLQFLRYFQWQHGPPKSCFFLLEFCNFGFVFGRLFLESSVFVFGFVFACVFGFVITGASVDSMCHELSETGHS